MKKVYLSHPYGGKEENREAAAALAKMFREIWAAEGKDYELIDPLAYLAPLILGERTPTYAFGIPKHFVLK